MPKTQIVPCTKEEIDAILEAASDKEFYYMLFKVAAKTGRRLGEYFDVQVKDLDFERKIMMTKVLKRRKPVYKEAILDDELVGLIKRYIAKEKLKLDDYLFRKVSYRGIQNAITSYARKAGVQHKVSFHCVSEDTEILTVEGCKKYNQINIGDKIFSYNLKKDYIEPTEINEKFVYDYEGEMYHIKNKYIDSLITPNHKIIAKYSVIETKDKIRKDVWNDYNLIKIEDLMKIKSLRQAKYKLSSFKINKGLSIGKAKAGLLGWILSDAHIGKHGDISIVQCSNANPKKCEIISRLLAESGIPYTINIQKETSTGYNKNNGKKNRLIQFRLLKGIVRNYCSDESKKGKEHDWIYRFINKDRTPILSEILKLKREELEMIYENMMLGDGTRGREYCGQNKKRIEFIRILCCLLNKRTSMGDKPQNGKIYSRTYISGDKLDWNWCDIHHNISKKKYKGIIWCPSTKNKTFIARRNGTIFITGNCFRHYFCTSLIKQGWSYDKVAKLTGHGSAGTLAIYDHSVASDIADEARDAIGKI